MSVETALIEQVRAGARIITKFTLYAANHSVNRECDHQGRWRTVACDSEQDVLECSACGLQKVARCDFDEEFS